jgi:hypothetical protein
MFERDWILEISINKNNPRNRLIAALRIEVSNMKPKIKGICEEKEKKNTF